MPTCTNVSVQVEQRCPNCAALVRPGAPWCTLCYADLRPAPAQLDARPATPALDPALDPLTAPLALLERVAAHGSEVAGAAPVAEEPGVVAEEPESVPGASWPCRRCGVRVAFDELTCTSCGAPFLDAEANDDPVLRRIRSVSTPAKAAIMIGGSVGLAGLFLGLMYVLGAVF